MPPVDDDPLPSWRNGAPHRSLETFVARVVKDGGADCVPPPERIAVFDNDGCLCPENPLPFQLAFDPIVDGRACPGA